MPLYIRDDEVDALATKLQREMNAPSKTEAVRTALMHELERNRAKVPLRERIARLQAEAKKIGLPNPDFDMKKFTDEMWEE
ncbi:type II toxin-antitoxin system VapB family antitoxin [Mesorhizobium sp. M2C.T.Ca.TU.002.02.1.1]|jgi:antitoxin VapB|uniref:type II toxin-antitoxin system VapB family antitoxin n=1 Tax=Mesorhizobium sp. M2C.T.Ca.TU.002.02.1.1 TaxID=2496788 RepID=UPI000FCBF679|nr:type II toxin-antitoxin system VapB family antitoxin [Mesorhizobium sp. M2C.T.Ca.TU.002.02.1.1]RUU54157.1 histidinol dehydrogenase [Mesorhizobium sp. M2C.T.Ca.TU.002.02.1.1]RUU69345.1 histidinol dehydrogenase [Mesorhizobium sp. M2C.T.Ca.TU.009.01.2.1]